MKRTTIILALSFLSFFAPAMAEAVPFKVSFAATVPGTPGEPLLGMPVSGFFIYDDPLAANCLIDLSACQDGPVATVPVLQFLMNIGPFSYNLSHAPGSSVLAPLGHNVWGPNIPIASAFLPPGVAHMGICTMGAGVCFTYGTTPDNLSAYIDFGAENGLWTAQVPEPSSLAFLMSLTGVIAIHRAFRKSRATR